MPGTRVWVAAITVGVALAGADHAAAGAAPKVAVTSLSAAPATVAAGESLVARYTLRRDRASLRKGTLAFSLRPAHGKAVALDKATRVTKKLKRPGLAKGRATLRIPAATAAGTYRLRACLRATPKRGKAGRPACRTAKPALVVTRPVAAPLPSGAAGPAAPPLPAPAPGDPAPTPPSPPPPAGDGSDPARALDTANPRSVTPTLDPARAAEKVIGVDGGALSATAADGTEFTLSVPSGALSDDTRIVMTPVARIDGLPFDGLVGAVDLAPHGLRLYKPAILSFSPATPVPAGRQSPFLAAASGEDFHSYLMRPDPAKLETSLAHFTVAGLADGSREQRAAQQSFPPAGFEAQYEQRAAQLISEMREGEPFDEAAWNALNREYHDRVVRPRLVAAETDDELAELAIQTFLGWARQLELLTGSQAFEPEIAAGFESLKRINDNAYRVSFQRCVAGEVGQVQRLLGLARAAALLGFGTSDDVFDRLDRCLRFTLDYDLDAHYFWPSSSGGIIHQADLVIRTIDAPLRFDVESFSMVGDVPITVTHWYWYDYGCHCPGGSTREIRPAHARLRIDPGNPIERRSADGRVRISYPPPIPQVFLDPGELETNSAGNSGQNGTGWGEQENFYRNTWRLLGAQTQPILLYTASPFLHTGGNPWATYAASESTDSGEPYHITESAELNLRLRHTPQP